MPSDVFIHVDLAAPVGEASWPASQFMTRLFSTATGNNADLPDARGLAVYTRLHSGSDIKTVPLVLTSAWIRVGPLATNAGAGVRLEGPVDFEILPQRLYKLLRCSPTAKAADHQK
jgi:hypothetical protein